MLYSTYRNPGIFIGKRLEKTLQKMILILILK